MAKTRQFRAGSQCDRVLKALLKTPLTNWQLNRITIKYTQRVSELREAKWDIVAHDLGGGLWKYVLMGKTT
jgi:hypothetical protein